MKHFVIFLLLCGFFISCDSGKEELLGPSTQQIGKSGLGSYQSENSDEYSQVYISFWKNGIAMSLPLNNTSADVFSHTNDVIGAPFITQSINDGVIPGLLENSQDSNFQWTTKGKIYKGKMSITFSSGVRVLSPLYESIFTEGARIAEVIIMNESRSVDYELRKLIEVDTTDFGNYEYNNHRIHIYYTDNNFNKFNNGTVSLKAGWNFVETFTVLHKDGRKYPFEYEIGLVSQDINDFYKAGYRWFYSSTSDGSTPQ